MSGMLAVRSSLAILESFVYLSFVFFDSLIICHLDSLKNVNLFTFFKEFFIFGYFCYNIFEVMRYITVMTFMS